MGDKRSKYSPSVKNKVSSVIGIEMKIPQGNFLADFLFHWKEYNIHPSPAFEVRNCPIENPLLQRIMLQISQKQIQMEKPKLYLTYENPKKLDTLRKIESKDNNVVSICILNVLASTVCKYNTLAALSLPNCCIDAYGVMQIAELLSSSGCLRDLNLDMNPNVQENFYMLCASNGNLRYLSLKLCKISDEGVEKIANELKYRDPPNEPQLLFLNLSNNIIGCAGALHIASMLRTNRSLQSLVLTGNKICDDGAISIIQNFNMFPLTHLEIVDIRRRKFDYLTMQNKKTAKNDENERANEATNLDESRNNRFRRRGSTRSYKKMAQESGARKSHDSENLSVTEGLSVELITQHPFLSETVSRQNSIMCLGNFQLQHLNLSFNHLTGRTLKTLITCTQYQNYMILDDSSRGLLHVFLEGNQLGIEDTEDLSMLTAHLQSKQSESRNFHGDDFNDLTFMESQILPGKNSKKNTKDEK